MKYSDLKRFFNSLGDFIVKFLMIFTSFSLLAISLFVRLVYGDLPLEQILLHFVPLTPTAPQYNLLVFLLIFLFLLLTFLLKPSLKKKPLAIILFILCAIFLSLFRLAESFEPTTLFEKNYKFPNQQTYTVSNKNIIIIHLESMEDSFLREDMTPFLIKLKKENLSFVNHQSIYGTDWTISSLISTYNALPLKTWPLNLHPETFLKKAPSLFDVLNRQGYNVEFFPTSIHFTHTGQYLENQNCQKIFSEINTSELQEETNFFGIDDRDTFRIAKTEILRLSSENKPFFFGFQTINTHLPGWLSSDCERRFDNIKDSIACLDKRLDEFISWLQEQPFYANTLVVLMGDHLMPKNLKQQERHVLNIFIHSEKTPVGEIEKPYTMLDITPTILEAAGIETQTHQFGLGVSLFSDKPTLVERMGKETLDTEIRKSSVLYSAFCQE